MKKLILITLLSLSLFTSSTVYAASCFEVSDMAKLVMEARQYGVSINAMMEVVEKESNKELKNLVRLMVVEAYKVPRDFMPEYRTRTITEFSNTWYVTCLETQ